MLNQETKAQYPKWLYHASLPATVVSDEAAHKALGAGWVESPVDVKAALPKEDETVKELAEPKDELKHHKKVK